MIIERRSATIVAMLTFGLAFFPGTRGVFSQTSEHSIRFLPPGLDFAPLVAHYHEPRTGVRGELGSTRLKLDIGSLMDLVEIRLSENGDSRLRFGAQFFVLALTTSYNENRLQVDATDGFFGGHVVWRIDQSTSSLSLRLRIIHLSSHMVDGHFDPQTDSWKGGREPVPYTRDFGELTGAFSGTFTDCAYRIYLGLSYATLSRPANLERWAAIQGIELTSGTTLGDVFGQPCAAFAAYNLSLSGIPEYIGTNNIECGMKFGTWEGTGVRIYISYWSGLSMFRQYYDMRSEQWGLGFTFDVW